MEQKIEGIIKAIDNYGNLMAKFDLANSLNSAENQTAINELESELTAKTSEITSSMSSLAVEDLCRLQQKMSINLSTIGSQIYGTVSSYGSELLGKDLIFSMAGKIKSYSGFIASASRIIESKNKKNEISGDFAKPVNVNSDETNEFLKSVDVSDTPVNEYNYEEYEAPSNTIRR